MQRKDLQCLCQIMSQGGVNRLRVLLALELSLIDPNQLLPAAGIFAKAVVGDPVKPGVELRLAAKAADVLVSAHKSLLREVVRQSQVRARELPEQPAHRRLMAPNEFSKGMLIVIDKDAGDEVGIGQ